jgi:hypothetical protein
MTFLSKSLRRGYVGTFATVVPWMAQESVQIRILIDDLVAHQYRHAARAVLVGAVSTKHHYEDWRTDGVVKLYVTNFTSECVDIIAGKLFEKALVPKMIREFATDVLFVGAPWQTVTTFEIDQRAVRAAFVGDSLNTFRHTLHTLRKEFAHRRYVHRIRRWMYMSPALSNERAANFWPHASQHTPSFVNTTDVRGAARF